MPIHSDLSWIYALHQFRSIPLDYLMIFLNFFDRQEFFLLLVPILWSCYRWQLGRRIFYLLSLSTLVNLALKLLFAYPRPFVLDPSVGLIQVPQYSFPSGAAQSAILIAGLLISHWKNRWRWCIAFLYIVSVSFSRIYLGAHFPIDILAGWVFGSILWLCYVFLFPKIETRVTTWSPIAILCLTQAFFLLLIIFFPSPVGAMIGSCGSGIEWGIFLNAIYFGFAPPPFSKKDFWLRLPIAPGGVLLLYGIHAILFPFHSNTILFLIYFFLGLWVSWISNGICKWISLQVQKQRLS